MNVTVPVAVPPPAPAGATATMNEAQRQASSRAPAATCATCPERSLRFRLGWTFAPNQVPAGTYQLIPGMAAAAPIPANGRIVLDRASGKQVPATIMRGQLVVQITNGPSYRFDVCFDLPAIHEPTGLKRRLTNLGLYAGIDEFFDGRALWAIRAFKRIYMNAYTRNASQPEDDHLAASNAYSVSAAAMAAVQTAHGAHPGDNTAALTPPEALLQRNRVRTPDAGMFGGLVLKRGSHEVANAADDIDPRPGRPGAVWGGQVNPEMRASRPGYELCLGPYNEAAGEAPVENCVNLPQPIHMLQFALFEAGFWMVAGARRNSRTITRFGTTAVVGATAAANGVFASLDGGYGRGTHWAVREFQCASKMPKAAVEDVTVTQPLYAQRLITLPAVETSGAARYPEGSPVSGSVNADTALALQTWLDNRYRCPILIYASPNAQRLTPASWIAENLWHYDDLASSAPRMFALDFSDYYDIPAQLHAPVTLGGQQVAQPIVVGDYISYGADAGPRSVPPNHLWNIETTEVTPQTVYGRGGLTGLGLSAAALSTFKVIKAASIFECLGHYDSLNAYDRVTLSFGLCHWTLARISGSGTNDGEWEMGALFAFAAHRDRASWNRAFGNFGVSATKTWPFAHTVPGKWASTVQMQTEGGTVILCGVNTDAEENKYGKNWQFYYRALMANRTIPEFQLSLGAFAAHRIEGIRSHTFVHGGTTYTLGDLLTSEKAMAMAHRAHIYGPNSMVGSGSGNLPARLRTVLTNHPTKNQARENAVRAAVIAATPSAVTGHNQQIDGWTNMPAAGLMGATFITALTNNAISGTLDSFSFESP